MDKLFLPQFANSRAEALLMQPRTSSSSPPFVIPRNIMSSSTFDDEDFLWAHPDAPPIFDLPPPPRPPWLEDAEPCVEGDHTTMSKSQILHHLETCDNPQILGNYSSIEDAFHSVAVILVCSIIFVIILLSIGIYAFRRRKNLALYHQHSDHCHGGSDSMGHSSADSELQQTTPSHQLFQSSNPIKRTEIQSAQFPNNLLSMPNHYIPDNSESNKHFVMNNRHAATMSPSQRNQELISREFQQRFPQTIDRSRNLMELTDRPPAHLYHNYPHIIIGGQPFYLIPSDPSRSDEYEIDSYAYPQCVPIYEEIDNTIDKCPSECSANSDQGEIGSLRRQEDVSPRPLHRPITSHSQNTNSSDISSSDNSSNNPKLGPRVLVNPLVRDAVFQDTSFSDSYESTSNSSASQKMFKEVNESGNTMLKPQSSFRSSKSVARLPRKSPATHSTSSGSQSSSSIYYYSDTLKNNKGRSPNGSKIRPDVSSGGEMSTDSGANFSSCSGDKNSPAHLVLVDTEVILENQQRVKPNPSGNNNNKRKTSCTQV